MYHIHHLVYGIHSDEVDVNAHGENGGRGGPRTADAAGLSRGLELLWGLRERPRKGPKPGLSLERVVAAAVEVAATEGLAAVTMSRVAERLGFTTMSLYRYVESKEELLVLMIDHVIGRPSAAVTEAAGWRARLERWAWEMLEVYRRHPWMTEIPVDHLPVSPNQLTWMETGLQCFTGTGLAPAERLALVMLVNGYVRSQAELVGNLRRARREEGVTEAEMLSRYGRLLARVLDPGRFPVLHEMAVSGVFESPEFATDPDASHGEVGPGTEPDFDFGLQRVLDGVAAYLRARDGSAEAPA
nr:MAG: TetR family transcriptional regulator [Actinomycetota bacterium]